MVASSVSHSVERRDALLGRMSLAIEWADHWAVLSADRMDAKWVVL